MSWVELAPAALEDVPCITYKHLPVCYSYSNSLEGISTALCRTQLQRRRRRMPLIKGTPPSTDMRLA